MVTPFFETDRVQLFGGDSLAVLGDYRPDAEQSALFDGGAT